MSSRALSSAGTATRPNQREHILDSALRLMSERGSAGMSMRQHAKACDLNVAAIYHYFESKDALLAAVVEERRYGARLADAPPIDSSAPPLARVQAIFTNLWEGALAEEAVWRLLLGEGLRAEPGVLPVGRQLLDVLQPGLSAWLNSAVPELPDSDAAASILIGQMLSGFIRHVFDPERSTSDIGADGLAAITASFASLA